MSLRSGVSGLPLPEILSGSKPSACAS